MSEWIKECSPGPVKKHSKTYFLSSFFPFQIPFCLWLSCPGVPFILELTLSAYQTWLTCSTSLNLLDPDRRLPFLTWRWCLSAQKTRVIFYVYSHAQAWPEMVRSYEWILANIIHFNWDYLKPNFKVIFKRFCLVKIIPAHGDLEKKKIKSPKILLWDKSTVNNLNCIIYHFSLNWLLKLKPTN